ncbi:MAG TPA: histidine kinase dimerization/phosphoacceptor domain -containing protein [Pyrinomonadaceae bacterium]|jgi:PAS domain S-box-containing protein|nr:histidine kinase dimerization/phosphoacceptor domain -containing protein [Pyrinomonadaceae bacterium]
MNRRLRTSVLFWSPLRFLVVVLAVVFVSEAGVMFVLPYIFNGRTSYLVESLSDASLLTLVSAPVLWLIIILPLRRVAVTEQAKFEAVVETAGDGIVTADESGRVETFNAAAERMFGYSADEINGEGVPVLLSAEARDGGVRLDEAIGSRREAEGRRKDGSIFPVELNVGEVNFGERRIFTLILRDITERKREEEKIRASLREKEILLKEIHHRVKNNLQIISSLLNLQSAHIRDPHALEVFKEGQGRVRSMALIHEKLYQSDDLARVDFSEYIRNLAAYLFRSYEVNAGAVRLSVEAEDVLLGVDTAIPCGLIINELVSNSLKHAFPGGTGGSINIRLRPADAERLTLTVADDGVGLPEGFDVRATPSLGLQLVNTLARQLGGDVLVGDCAGAEFSITFRKGD